VTGEAGDLVAEELACRRGERLVFAGLGCALPPGGALVLTGANGSGKSSLLRLFATLLAPAAGRLLWDGLPVTADIARYRARVHHIGHLDAIKPSLTVRETLCFWAGLRAVTSTRLASTLDAALAAFALDALADWPCRWLSAGQRRRLALARMLAAPAEIWLLDEPTAALDSDGEARLFAAIALHRAGGGRVVAATHQPLALAGAAMLALENFVPRAIDSADDPLAGL
jgi:heme exporter protein A